MERLAEQHTIPRWLMVGLVWGGIALFDATQTVTSMHAQGMHHDWPKLFLTVLLSWVPWMAATPVIVQLGRRHLPTLRSSLKIWPVHVLACLTIAIVASAWNCWFQILWNPYMLQPPPGPFLKSWAFGIYNNLLVSLVLYALILLVSVFLDAQARIAQQQTETARLNELLSQAKLDALRRQIEPHFLFNSLNSVAGLVREGRNDDAVSMIAGLSELLRKTLDSSNVQLVPLLDEMEFTRRYLEIQKVRFTDRLTFKVSVPEEVLQAHVPSLILQPIVENAMKHGISRRAHGGEIRIAAQKSNGTLRLTVYNDGPGLLEESDTAGPGIGISNMRARLRSLYGNDFQLKMQDHGEDGVEVMVAVPYREA